MKEFLPTFNCNTIETHLHCIHGLSEKFIYFNDDNLIMGEIDENEYFIGDKCVYYMKKEEENTISSIKHKFYTYIKRNNMLVINNFLKKFNLKYIYYNSHGPTPMLKTICEEIYNKIDIKNHISVFREKNNLTQELFTLYALVNRKLILLKNSVNNNVMIAVSNNKYCTAFHNKFKKDFFNLCSPKITYCLNDEFNNEKIENNDFLLNEINKIIKLRFNRKCKYEL